MPMLVVHDGTTHMGHRRDNGQFHQAFLLKLALKLFRQGFAEPQGVDQVLIGNTLACVSFTPCVKLLEERYPLWLHRVERHHGGFLRSTEAMHRSTTSGFPHRSAGSPREQLDALVGLDTTSETRGRGLSSPKVMAFQ
jgi:hypothetical protein